MFTRHHSQSWWPPAVPLLVFLTMSWASTAYAQTKDAPKMNRLNEEGFIEFRAGRFNEAAAKFRAAYEAYPDPNLRKNEAVAWFKGGRCENAIPAANSFLMDPETSDGDRLEARSILANCRVEMARDALKSENMSLAESLLDEAEGLEPDRYARDQIAIARVELSQRKSSLGRQTSNQQNPAGWVMVASGAAVVGGTLVYWLLTIPDRNASKNLSPNDPGYEAAAKRARTSRWLVPVGILGGGAVAGIGLYIVLAGGGDGTGSGATAGLWYRW